MKKRLFRHSGKALLSAAFVAAASAGFAAAFTPGNLVVVRVGTGAAVLVANQAEAVTLDEYTTAGVLVQSVPLPTTVSGLNMRLTLGGLNNAEGAISRSPDGQYLAMAGYDAAVGAAGIVAAASTGEARVVAKITASGAVDTTTAFTDANAFSGGRIASAVTDDGNRFWSAGSGTGGGVRYATLGQTTSQPITGTPNNNLVLQIFNDQLYSAISFNPNYDGIAAIKTGLPTSGVLADTPTLLPGFPVIGNHAHKGFFFSDANTLFVCEAGTSTTPATDIGIQKWTFNGTTWAQATTPFPYPSPYVGIPSAPGFLAMAGTVSGNNITLYLTTSDASDNRLVKWASTDSGASGTFTILTAPSRPSGSNPTEFRGVTLAPVAISEAKSWTKYQ